MSFSHYVSFMFSYRTNTAHTRADGVDSQPSAADPNTHSGFVGEEITD